MNKTPMTDENLHEQAIGHEIQFSENVKKLLDVEQYFIQECTKKKVFWSYDVTANEPLYFGTINYTTFAGTFIIHPLQPEMRFRQMHDALRDSVQEKDFVSFFRQKIESKTANKYTDRKKLVEKQYEAIVVLPGDNKIKSHICRRKLKQIIERHGDNVIFKPHPLTRPQTLVELKELIGAKDSHFAPIESDLYDILVNCEYVYTSHLSESAIYSVAIDKSISPIDQFDNRHLSSFAHINHFLFHDFEPKKTINQLFSSYKSGIICPAVDTNWKEKIDLYLDYILKAREKIKNYYVQGEI
jgi:hypothetical protein